MDKLAVAATPAANMVLFFKKSRRECCGLFVMEKNPLGVLWENNLLRMAGHATNGGHGVTALPF